MTRIAIVGGCRTPFVKAGGALGSKSFLDLGIHAVKALTDKLQLKSTEIGELAFGTVLLDPRVPNAARELVIRSGLSPRLPAHFVSNNCISGLVAANMIAEGIRAGRISCGLAGGSESMSRPALSFSPQAERFFLRLFGARSIGKKLSTLSSFKPGYILPQAPSPKEPSTGLTMGQHCELTAQEFGIARGEQDRVAYASHANAAKAQSAGLLAQEIVPIDGVDRDNIIRADTSIEKLAKLPPVFERSAKGTLTAGNSSPLTDGASVVCLMSEDQAKRQGREILAFLEHVEFSAIAPSDGLLMAPALALP
ncbi:MAG: acetyl-CoA C-acyltransferase, partial [Oligoflexia bacterium]|nr:acetyl-CoA C-acyltransferase [Oligoflexia bacterium]